MQTQSSDSSQTESCFSQMDSERNHTARYAVGYDDVLEKPE